MRKLPRGKLIAAVGIVALGVVVMARGTSKTSDTRPKRVSVPYDWSHRHVVFSKPATLQQAAQLQREPRYWHQLLRRNAVGRRPGTVSGALELGLRDAATFRGTQPAPASPLGRDWAVSLGTGASTGSANFPQYPAKFTFDISPGSITCTDFVAFPTSVAGVTGISEASPGQPSIVAYENLYSATDGSGACPTNGPTISWAYNTNASGDTTGVVNGSPVMSGDGTRIAFVESNPSGSVLHLLQFIEFEGLDSNGVMVVVTPTNLLTSGNSWTACPSGQSCMISLPLSASTATNASPFYDFAFDALFVGDDSGVLHKFTGVFNGTPTEVTTGWPITVHAGAGLTPAVQDSATNTLFVGDSTGMLSFVRDTGSTTGACAIGVPPCVGSVTIHATDGSAPIFDSPTLDPTTGKVFVFVGDSGANNVITGVGRGAYLVQANEDLTGVIRLSQGRFGAPLHSGALDNTYFNSSPGATAGFMWVCGKGATDVPTLRRVAFNADGTIKSGGAVVRPVGSGAGNQCSPVTEIFNPNIGAGTDLIFFSVDSGDLAHIGPPLPNPPGNLTNCVGTGCVLSFDITAGTVPVHVLNSLPEFGGTSGIIIDNVGTDPQEANIYFSRLRQSALSSCGGSGASLVGCAVKLTQAGLN
jgi:hypothetical protein